MSTNGGFSNPLGILDSGFETRPSDIISIEDTGRFELDRLFRGNAALFAGLRWQATDRVSLLAEYSSDAYERESRNSGFDRRSPYNVGATYTISPTASLSGYYLYGSELGFRLSYTLNPKVPATASGVEPGPVPISPRPARGAVPGAWSTGWVAQDVVLANLQQQITAALGAEGLLLETIDVQAEQVRVSVRNKRFDQAAQAVGRASRILTRLLPASVETFHIVLLTSRGLPTSEVTLKRTDLEQLEFAPDNSWKSYVRTQVTDAAAHSTPRQSLTQPKLTFALAPYTKQSFFDPDQPLSFDAGVRADLRYEPRPRWVVDASVRQPFFGNRDSINRPSNSALPFVRSEQDDFNRSRAPKLDELTLSHYFRPGKSLYGRVTVGYLEVAYAGISSEVLWKPTQSRLAMGIELNAVHQRQPGDPFGLGNGIFDNDALTGHASLYYAFENGFHTQLDVGRYLAEDWGGTFTLTREFRNGWQVGAFFTLTDVSFDDFGEGAFDKGIFFTIPTAWSTGQPSKKSRTGVLRPVLRDGGARVNVSNRLYETIRSDSAPLLSDGWGRFWR